MSNKIFLPNSNILFKNIAAALMVLIIIILLFIIIILLPFSSFYH